jgi:hypothetical protein
VQPPQRHQSNPRRDSWERHFVIDRDGHIIGLTPTGTATVRLLDMNGIPQLNLRQVLIANGERANPRDRAQQALEASSRQHEAHDHGGRAQDDRPAVARRPFADRRGPPRARKGSIGTAAGFEERVPVEVFVRERDEHLKGCRTGGRSPQAGAREQRFELTAGMR